MYIYLFSYIPLYNPILPVEVRNDSVTIGSSLYRHTPRGNKNILSKKQVP